MALTHRKRIAAAAAVLAVVATLTGGDVSAGGSAPTARASEAHATVEISEFKFKPFALTIARGTEVRFANRDSTTHEPAKRGSFDTGPIAPGKSASVHFTQPGTYRYVCAIHPFMHGKVIVRR